MPVPVHFVKVAFKLPDWMEPLSWIQPLVRLTHRKHIGVIGVIGVTLLLIVLDYGYVLEIILLTTLFIVVILFYICLLFVFVIVFTCCHYRY